MTVKKTLILNHEEVKALLDLDIVIKAVEEAFHDHYLHYAENPDRTALTFNKYSGMLGIMPCYIEGLDACGVKIISHHGRNFEKGLPESMGLIVFNDPSTGFPLAIMDSVYITKARTGAASAVSAKYLSREDSEVIGLIGTGATSVHQILALCSVRKIKKINIFDINPIAMETFKNKLSYFPVVVKSMSGCEEICSRSDILVTCTTSVSSVIRGEWIKPGTHIISVGADMPQRRELDPGVFNKAVLIVTDLINQAMITGDINDAINAKIIQKEKTLITLGEIVTQKKQERSSNSDITIFKSTGMAIQDIATANIIYDLALKNNVGQKIYITP